MSYDYQSIYEPRRASFAEFDPSADYRSMTYDPREQSPGFLAARRIAEMEQGSLTNPQQVGELLGAYIEREIPGVEIAIRVGFDNPERGVRVHAVLWDGPEPRHLTGARRYQVSAAISELAIIASEKQNLLHILRMEARGVANELARLLPNARMFAAEQFARRHGGNVNWRAEEAARKADKERQGAEAIAASAQKIAAAVCADIATTRKERRAVRRIVAREGRR